MTDGLVKGKITDESVEKMRMRIGYPNPTVRSGITVLPWNTEATSDAIRHYAEGYGDANPLFVDRSYGESTRWGGQIAPPGFDATMGLDRSPQPSAELAEASKGALRGVQLFHSGNEAWFYRPVRTGDVLTRTNVVASVDEKERSDFAERTVVVTNRLTYWDEPGTVVATVDKWFVHAERRKTSDGKGKYRNETLAHYTDAELAEIENAYDNEYLRGADTWWYEDVVVGQSLPTLVKGPLTVTDMINFHMGGGWMGYGNPALRLAYENRKKLRGFYTRDEYNGWDVVQRVHWDPKLAQEVGVLSSYDIGPMRWSWLCHYCTNLAGDDGWPVRLRTEFRRFNYMGDTTWLRGTVTQKRVDPELGPCVEIDITGTNQRGSQNVTATATILVASREHGPVQLPSPPATPAP
jgi:acyl dehydratase